MNRPRGGSRRPSRGGGPFNKPRTVNRAGLSVSTEKEQEELDEKEDDDHFLDSLAEINVPSAMREKTQCQPKLNRNSVIKLLFRDLI